MKPWKRLLFYLTLNVLVSACTILVVLFAWDQLRGPLPRDLLPEALRFLAPQETSQTPGSPQLFPTATPYTREQFIRYAWNEKDTLESVALAYQVSVEELAALNGVSTEKPPRPGDIVSIPAASVTIESVVAAGDLQFERVVLKHRGEGELVLDGWRLEDGSGNQFIFPQVPRLVLFKGGAVNVYTRSGANTVVDLYWGMPQAVWYSGATVVLRDAVGNVRFVYKIP